ncbi:MAG TPA: carboxypeptidase-like regulatory domain-containing protein [Sphingomicrobium sp.]
MFGGRNWLRKAALSAALCASAVSGAATAATAPAWTADPDAQFLLDVQIRQLRLGDGVRAYNTPEGTCVVLGDFLTTLDVPMHVDITAKKASGWAFKESNKISIDYAASTASYGSKHEAIAPGTIRETPEGWCVQATALSRWFGIGVTAVTSGSVLVLQSQAKLPVELTMEREARAARIKPAKFDLASLPQIRIPYRMWRAPALDFVVSAGATYRASDGLKVDRQSSVYAAGEIARLSYDAQVTTDQKGMPASVRLRAYRSDPDGHLLGPAKATHFGFGDVEGFGSKLTGNATYGRGAVITNRPLTSQSAFDQSHFEGDLPAGWEAELYRNNELLAFSKPTSDQRYVFDNVQLLYGENQIRIVLYGPQGQIRERDETINVGQDNAPPGKTWYWAGFNQPSRDIFALQKPPDGSELPKAQATVALEHGIDDRTSVAALARAMLIGDQRVTFVEGTVRRSVGAALIEAGASRESNGGIAARAQLLGKIGPVNVDAQALIANDFHLNGGKLETVRDYSVALDAPLKIGRTVLPAHADVHMTELNGTKALDAAARLSANLDRFNLATEIHYRKQLALFGQGVPAQTTVDFIGSGHIGDIRLRGETSFDVSPAARLQSMELEAYWSASENVDWEGDLVYEATAHRARARVSYIRRLSTLAVALTGEAASDGSLAFGVNLNFSLDPRHGIAVTRRPLAQAGEVHALVYRDLNDDGLREAGEPLEKGAMVTTGAQQAEQPTDSKGSVVVGGLIPFQPIAVGVDVTSLADPMLVPKKALQVVVPRPGIPMDVEIGLVGGGDVEGALIKSGGVGFEGVDLELVDANGKVVARTRTDYDGFFLFERVAYGSYAVRVSKDSAAAAKIADDLGVHFVVTPDKSVIRLGTIQPTKQQHIADASAAAARSSLR